MYLILGTKSKVERPQWVKQIKGQYGHQDDLSGAIFPKLINKIFNLS